MNRCLDFSHKLCRISMAVISTLIVSVVFFLNLFYTTAVAYSTSEKVTIRLDIGCQLLMLTVAALVLVLIWVFRFKKPSVRLTERTLFLICTVAYTLAAVFLIVHVDGSIRADASLTFRCAAGYNRGDYSSFTQEGYLYMYPHQLGIMTFDRLLLLFSKSPKLFFAANFVMVLVINRLLYKIAAFLFENRWVNLLTIACSFAFLPQFFFILFAYGVIPGLCCMMAAFYFVLLLARTGKWRYLIPVTVFAALAVIMKKNFLIGVIAAALYLLVYFLRDRKWQKLAAAGLLALCMVLPSNLLISAYERATGYPLDNASPSVLWIAMGTDIDNCRFGPGWYDVSTVQIYNESGRNAAAAAEVGKEKLAHNLEKIMQQPLKAAVFFKNKTVSQWCDPLYQSVWSGPLKDCGQTVKTPLLEDIFSGGPVNQAMTYSMKFLNLMLWLLAGIFLICFAKTNTGWELFYIFFVGGFLFHCIWEAKSQYTMPYVVGLIPFAMYALFRLCTWDAPAAIKKLLRTDKKEEAP